MVGYFIKVLQNYAVFTGRARRAEYWYFFLAYILLSILIGIGVGVIGVVAGMNAAAIDFFAGFLANVINVALLVPTIAVGVRRMHDVNKSGWFILVPFYNLYLAVQPGTSGPNRFGLDPKGEAELPLVPVPVPLPPVVE